MRSSARPDLKPVVALHPVDHDRDEPAHDEHADDPVADHAEIIVDVADRIPERAFEIELLPIKPNVSMPPITNATTTETM